MDYTVYISNKCDFCNQLMSEVSNKQLTNINFVDISKKQVPNGIHSVPTIISSNGKIYVGRQCFTLIDSMNSSSISGLDSSNDFSFIDNSISSNHAQPFSFIENTDNTLQSNSHEQNMMDELIAKRKNEVPQPLVRR